MEQRLTSPLVHTGTKLAVGLFIAALGVLMTLDNLALFDATACLRYWPLILIVVGALKLTDAASRGTGVALVAAGTLFLGLTTRLVRLSVFDLWPLFLIGAGLFLVAQAIGLRTATHGGRTLFAILSNRRVTIDSRDYTGGRLAAFMGSAQLDFSSADIVNGPAVLEVFVLMGGVEVRVPDGWEVVGEAIPFMGGIDINTRSRSTGRQLIIRGFIMMGGMEIKDAAARNA